MPSATVLPKKDVKKVVGASSVEENEESVAFKGMLSTNRKEIIVRTRRAQKIYNLLLQASPSRL